MNRELQFSFLKDSSDSYVEGVAQSVLIESATVCFFNTVVLGHFFTI